MYEIAHYILKKKKALTLPIEMLIVCHQYISRPKCGKCPLCICYLLITFYLFDFKDFFNDLKASLGLLSLLQRETWSLWSIFIKAAISGVLYLPD